MSFLFLFFKERIMELSEQFFVSEFDFYYFMLYILESIYFRCVILFVLFWFVVF